MIEILSAATLLLAALPAYFYFRNVVVFLPLPSGPDAELNDADLGEAKRRSAISVLIPARNEAANIRACIASVLASASEGTEIVVLDDHSSDGTAEIVRFLASDDPRVRLIAGGDLPNGWNGKQHACWQLANAARNQLLVFLDADVQLAPDALVRIEHQMDNSKADLLSGFPRQITGSALERLLIPLIHFVLLGYLSLRHMRRVQRPAFAAGCGQLFLTTRQSYKKSGGHAAIRSTRHDGIMLPRRYLQQGLTIDLFDATDLASVRMYDGPAATWQGLSKNADEGIATPRIILPVTLLLLGGQVLPIALVASGHASIATLAATLLAYLPRLDAVRRFHQSWFGALLHPIGVLIFLAIQWWALVGSFTGRQVAWKGRAAAKV